MARSRSGSGGGRPLMNGTGKDGQYPQSSSSSPYTITVSWKFLVLGLTLPTFLAFSVGWGLRVVLVERPQNLLQRELELAKKQQGRSSNMAVEVSMGLSASIDSSDSGNGNGHETNFPTMSLPVPIMKSDRDVPKTLYSSKNFDTSMSNAAHSVLIEKKAATAHLEKAQLREWRECPTDIESGDELDNEDIPEHCKVSPESVALYVDEDEDDDDDDEPRPIICAQGETPCEEEHLPAGQHLLVDLKGVDGSFLNDERRLAQAMVDVVWEADLTLLSYHCHTLLPTGVSCVGVLLESHVSFHTWPVEGVITLDLFTCGSGLLIPVIPIIERVFGVPPPTYLGQEVVKPFMVWSHKLRGFRPKGESKSLSLDIGKLMLGPMVLQYKEKIASVQTDFQRIDIYDTIDPRYNDEDQHYLSLANGTSSSSTYESTHPEFFAPDRKVFLDGILQSSRLGLEAYHEAVVHPGLITHPNPRRVAIVGGGEGATLREVLKHKTVETVYMLEIDTEMVSTSREYLPGWNRCSDLVGSRDSCFDDPRARVETVDAVDWFIDRFGDDADIDEEKFDVIIWDALDPQDEVDFADVLYSDAVFTRATFNALNDDGLAIMQLGQAPQLKNAPDEFSKSHLRAKLTKQLEHVGFGSMHAYSESHCQFGSPWAFLVACKDYSCRQNWYSNTAQIDLEIQKRVLPTHSGSAALAFFDGATMQTYQVPPKGFETVFCRKAEKPVECQYLNGYDPLVPNIPGTSFELKDSGGSRAADGLGVYAKEGIAQGSMIMQETSVEAMDFPPKTLAGMKDLAENSQLEGNELDAVLNMLDDYGFENRLYGAEGYDVPTSVLALLNHGCNGTSNVNADPNFYLTEETADPDVMPFTLYPKGHWKGVFNPVVERHLPHLINGFDLATRDIQEGEELLENFLSTVSSEENWKSTMEELNEYCGVGKGQEGGESDDAVVDDTDAIEVENEAEEEAAAAADDSGTAASE